MPLKHPKPESGGDDESREQSVSSSSSPQQAKQEQSSMHALEEEVVSSVGPNDVLMGRGAPITENAGNTRLRQMVTARYPEYASAQRHKDKHEVAVRIVRDVMSSGGKFLRKIETPADQADSNDPASSTSSSALQLEPSPSRWIVVNDEKLILIKVKQLLRDMGPEAQERRLERQRYRYRKLGVKTPGKTEPPQRTNTAASHVSTRSYDLSEPAQGREPTARGMESLPRRSSEMAGLSTSSATTYPQHHSVAHLDLHNHLDLLGNLPGMPLGRNEDFPTVGNNFPALPQFRGFPDSLQNDALLTNASLRPQLSNIDPIFFPNQLGTNDGSSRGSLGRSNDGFLSLTEAERILQQRRLLSPSAAALPAAPLAGDGLQMSQNEYIRLLRQAELSKNISFRQHMFTQNMMTPSLSPLDALRLQRLSANTNQPPFFASLFNTHADLFPGYPRPHSVDTTTAATAQANIPARLSSSTLLQSLLRDSSSYSHPMWGRPSQPFTSSRMTQGQGDDSQTPATNAQSAATTGPTQPSTGGSDDDNQEGRQ
uniref:DUF6824 domain-containing protein n=1 Tax=Amphora coffeiformis TaxID=265554 RepID=A0A6S8JZU1_9STRA